MSPTLHALHLQLAEELRALSLEGVEAVEAAAGALENCAENEHCELLKRFDYLERCRLELLDAALELHSAPGADSGRRARRRFDEAATRYERALCL